MAASFTGQASRAFPVPRTLTIAFKSSFLHAHIQLTQTLLESCDFCLMYERKRRTVRTEIGVALGRCYRISQHRVAQRR